MKQIQLTRGLVALVDDDIFVTASKFKWHATRASQKRTWYAARCVSRVGTGISTKQLMHREIMSPSRDQVIDHIDGNGLNNCRSNLRICDRAKNRHNIHTCLSASGFVGVSYLARHSKWQAAIKRGGITHYLGLFRSPEEAAQAYQRKRRELEAA